VIPGCYPLGVTGKNRENGGVSKEGIVIGSPNNNGKRILGNMPSNYTKDIRIGLTICSHHFN
jgi:hypothetical protein